MEFEDKVKIIREDLCARLPYGVRVQNREEGTNFPYGILLGWNEGFFNVHVGQCWKEQYKLVVPYLRPMSSITDEERDKCFKLAVDCELEALSNPLETDEDWIKNFSGEVFSHNYLNQHMYDYRGLIGLGLALEAPEGMYSFQE